MTAAIAIRTAIVFRRGHIKDKQAFNLWVDELIDKSPCDGLIIFPEGTRGQGLKSQPLKRGMLHYAYSRKLPVQIVISDGKEDVMQEKKWHIGFGKKVKVGYSEIIESGDYEGFEDFLEKIQSVWDEMWQQVFKADIKGLPQLTITEQRRNYPLAMRALLLVCALVGLIFASGLVYIIYKIAIFFVGFPFPANFLIWMILICWNGLSICNAFIEEAPARKQQREELNKSNGYINNQNKTD
eukprot:TRINITY_DN620_c0_g2_i1.p1 TRINITY_DN620_c0_g2~~TRINITY_DN620_c0_g2_i1.p1  ORF type:complete len:276 (-),score=28.95 TRINITY_DN620_c0_g2_i1:207-926(-)